MQSRRIKKFIFPFPVPPVPTERHTKHPETRRRISRNPDLNTGELHPKQRGIFQAEMPYGFHGAAVDNF